MSFLKRRLLIATVEVVFLNYFNSKYYNKVAQSFRHLALSNVVIDGIR